MLHIERFKMRMINTQIPITDATHKLDPTYDFQKEVKEYYDFIQKQQKEKQQKEKESYEKRKDELSKPSMIYYENRYQYKTPERYFDTVPNLGCDDKKGVCMSNCLPQQNYPNTPKIEMIITNGSPINMVEKIFPKATFIEKI